MSAAVPIELNHIVKVAQIYVASTTAVLVWDWLACLPKEWKYIWKSSWSPIKILYLIVRYYTFVVLIATDVWFLTPWSQRSCSKHHRTLPGLAVFIELAVEAVLCLRVYALYGQSKRVAWFLVLIIAGFLGVMIAVPVLAFDYAHLPQWPGPCFVTGKPSIAGPKFIIAFYASPMCIDMIVTAMTVYKSFTVPVNPAAFRPFVVFVRNGLFYFAAITSVNLINVIFFIQRNTEIQPINAAMSIQLSSVLCCRLILNLSAVRDEKRTVKQFPQSRNRPMSGRSDVHAMKDLEADAE